MSEKRKLEQLNGGGRYNIIIKKVCELGAMLNRAGKSNGHNEIQKKFELRERLSSRALTRSVRVGFAPTHTRPETREKKTNRTEGQKGRTVSEPSVLAGEPGNPDGRVYVFYSFGLKTN